jgi:hypothetical protein
MSHPTSCFDPYGACIAEASRDKECPISLDDLYSDHPLGIFTLYNGYNSETRMDYPLNVYLTIKVLPIFEGQETCAGADTGMKDPITRRMLSPNEILRVKWYRECMDKFPDITHDQINVTSIIDAWKANKTRVTIDMFRFFVKFEEAIEYFGFSELDTREKALKYLIDHPSENWVVRKGSVTDTQYNRFFVMTYKKKKVGITDDDVISNVLFVHRQGYGIMQVNADRYDTMDTVKFNESMYYTNFCDLLMALFYIGLIH